MYSKRLTPTDIRQRAENIEQNAARVSRELEHIQTLLDRLRPSVSADQAGKSHLAFQPEQSTMSEWEDIVRSFAHELRTVALRMESADGS